MKITPFVIAWLSIEAGLVAYLVGDIADYWTSETSIVLPVSLICTLVAFRVYKERNAEND